MLKTAIAFLVLFNTIFVSAQVPEEVVMSFLPSCDVLERLAARNTWIEAVASVKPQLTEEAMVTQILDLYDSLWSNMPRCREAMALILVSLRMDLKFYAVSLNVMEDVVDAENIQLQLAFGRATEALNIPIP